MAYNTADLDDAWSAGLITAEDVAQAVPQYRDIHEAVETQFPGATERERFHEALRQLIDLLVTGLIEGTVAAADGQRGRGFRGSDGPTRAAGRNSAPRRRETSRALKRFLFTRVYASDAAGRRPAAFDGARSPSCFASSWTNPDRLPQPYAQQALDEPAHRVVCDYIAGMTDGFFHRTYEQMLGAAVSPPLS